MLTGMKRPRAVLFALLALAAATADAQPCAMEVTNTNDSGPGSLRAALEAQACRISFAIPGEGPWHTIRVLTPLPPLPTGTQIDAQTQTARMGDTNPSGPEIELNGSMLHSGHGLEAGCNVIRGLAINGFPGNGILLAGDCFEFFRDSLVERNYIGCDPTGTIAIPNQRGIFIDGRPSDSWSPRYHYRIRDNVIGGNERSGIFVQRGKANITRNVIGLTVERNGPLANGASGVAILSGGYGTDVADNYIGFNHHFGVAIAGDSRNVALHGNSFQANGQLAIDFGMDGVSQSVPIYPNNGVFIGIPEIVNVRYEDGLTTIDIRASYLGNNGMGYVSVYANDAPDPSGYGEGQYFLGVDSQRDGRAGLYTFVHRGDLRGKWVTATATYRDFWGFANSLAPVTHEYWQAGIGTTSEFSRAMEVK